jgi:hypothetical protein
MEHGGVDTGNERKNPQYLRLSSLVIYKTATTDKDQKEN